VTTRKKKQREEYCDKHGAVRFSGEEELIQKKCGKERQVTRKMQGIQFRIQRLCKTNPVYEHIQKHVSRRKSYIDYLNRK
jgi:hypothetical protein